MTGQESHTERRVLDFQVESEVEKWAVVIWRETGERSIDEDLKHPFILPSHHHVTELLIQYHHSKVGHLGQESVLSSLRERFWVVKGRSAVRRTVKKCLDCQRRKAPTGEQFMAKLPEDRVTPHEPPLLTCWCGLFWAHRGEARKKSS